MSSRKRTENIEGKRLSEKYGEFSKLNFSVWRVNPMNKKKTHIKAHYHEISEP